MRAHDHDLTTSLGLLILRLGIGGYMLTHGIPKLGMLSGEGAPGEMDPIGIGPTATLVLAIVAEVLCALLVMAGAWTRPAAAYAAAVMAVAALKVHALDPWSMDTAVKAFLAGQSESFASKQPALMFAIPFLALVFTGAGRFSADALLGRKRK